MAGDSSAVRQTESLTLLRRNSHLFQNNRPKDDILNVSSIAAESTYALFLALKEYDSGVRRFPRFGAYGPSSWAWEQIVKVR